MGIMREIILSIKNDYITASTDFAGHQGEHNATCLKFELPAELQNRNYSYQANITLPDGITATATLKDMVLTLTSTLTACEGTIQLQLVITENSTFVYKSGVTDLKIKPSLAPTAIIGAGSGISSAIVNDDGNLIITLINGEEINAGYVKGDKGDKGDPYERKKFELIEAMTVSEENVSVIERTLEPNGTVYCFEEVLVNFEIEASDTTAFLLCYANNLGVANIGDVVNTTKQYSSLHIKENKGILLAEHQTASPVVTASGILRARNLELREVDCITSLKFSCNVAIPVGSKITIYAVRK